MPREPNYVDQKQEAQPVRRTDERTNIAAGRLARRAAGDGMRSTPAAITSHATSPDTSKNLKKEKQTARQGLKGETRAPRSGGFQGPKMARAVKCPAKEGREA